MIVFKIDVVNALKEKGYTTYSLRKNKLLGVKTYEELKTGKVTGLKTVDTLCNLLKCQPSHLIKYIPDTETDTETETEKN